MIPLVGYQYFLYNGLYLPADNVKVALIDEDFDGADKTLVYSSLSWVDLVGLDPQIYSPDGVSPGLTGDPYGVVLSNTHTFQPQDEEDLPITIYGIGVYNDAAGFWLIALHKFQSPVTLETTDDKIERGIDFYDREFDV